MRGGWIGVRPYHELGDAALVGFSTQLSSAFALRDIEGLRGAPGCLTISLPSSLSPY